MNCFGFQKQLYCGVSKNIFHWLYTLTQFKTICDCKGVNMDVDNYTSDQLVKYSQACSLAFLSYLSHTLQHYFIAAEPCRKSLVMSCTLQKHHE